MAVQRFHGREQVFEHLEVEFGAASGEAGEDVVDAEQDLLFVEIRGQSGHVVTLPLQLDVMPIFDPVYADMDLGSGRACVQVTSSLRKKSG